MTRMIKIGMYLGLTLVLGLLAISCGKGDGGFNLTIGNLPVPTPSLTPTPTPTPTVTPSASPTPVTYSFTASWTAPTTNADGSAVSGTLAYKVYYGTTSGVYTNEVSAGAATTLTVSDLPAGTYYVVVTAYYTAPSPSPESTYSNEGSVVKGLVVPEFKVTLPRMEPESTHSN